MEFKFFNYTFSSNLEEVKEYLIKENIKFIKTKEEITFAIDNEFCNNPINVTMSYIYDEITRIVLFCEPKSFGNRKKLEEHLNENYELVENSLNDMKKIYKGLEYLIYVDNSTDLWIDVKFHYIDEKKEQRKIFKNVILFTIFGVILSALFISLYLILNNLVLNIIFAIVAILYALWQFIFIYLRKALINRKLKIALCIIIPLLYMLVMFIAFIFLFIRIGGDFKYFSYPFVGNALMIFIYLSPSFHLLLLIMSGLTYA